MKFAIPALLLLVFAASSSDAQISICVYSDVKELLDSYGLVGYSLGSVFAATLREVVGDTTSFPLDLWNVFKDKLEPQWSAKNLSPVVRLHQVNNNIFAVNFAKRTTRKGPDGDHLLDAGANVNPVRMSMIDLKWNTQTPVDFENSVTFPYINQVPYADPNHVLDFYSRDNKVYLNFAAQTYNIDTLKNETYNRKRNPGYCQNANALVDNDDVCVSRDDRFGKITSISGDVILARKVSDVSFTTYLAQKPTLDVRKGTFFYILKPGKDKKFCVFARGYTQLFADLLIAPLQAHNDTPAALGIPEETKPSKEPPTLDRRQSLKEQMDVVTGRHVDTVKTFMQKKFEIFELKGKCLYRHAAVESLRTLLAVPAECALTDEITAGQEPSDVAIVSSESMVMISQGICFILPLPAPGEFVKIDSKGQKTPFGRQAQFIRTKKNLFVVNEGPQLHQLDLEKPQCQFKEVSEWSDDVELKDHLYRTVLSRYHYMDSRRYPDTGRPLHVLRDTGIRYFDQFMEISAFGSMRPMTLAYLNNRTVIVANKLHFNEEREQLKLRDLYKKAVQTTPSSGNGSSYWVYRVALPFILISVFVLLAGIVLFMYRGVALKKSKTAIEDKSKPPTADQSKSAEKKHSTESKDATALTITHTVTDAEKWNVTPVDDQKDKGWNGLDKAKNKKNKKKSKNKKSAEGKSAMRSVTGVLSRSADVDESAEEKIHVATDMSMTGDVSRTGDL